MRKKKRKERCISVQGLLILSGSPFQISHRDDVIKQLREELTESQTQYQQCYDEVCTVIMVTTACCYGYQQIHVMGISFFENHPVSCCILLNESHFCSHCFNFSHSFLPIPISILIPSLSSSIPHPDWLSLKFKSAFSPPPTWDSYFNS